jgi:hypothetical protein
MERADRLPAAGNMPCMNRLQTQYQRLYLLPEAVNDASSATGVFVSDGLTRVMVLSLGRPADWAALSRVWQGVQGDLGLPAPGIAVNGLDAFELWFSVVEPVAVTDAERFLKALRDRYADHLAPDRWCCWPPSDTGCIAVPDLERVPAMHQASGRWSAFIAPDLPAIFGDDPSLDVNPGNGAQADLLSRLASITPSDWSSALTAVGSGTAHWDASPSVEPNGMTAVVERRQPQADPRRFLMDVMNDKTVELALRIDAAKALLVAPIHPKA